MLEIRETDVCSPDARLLLEELNQKLSAVTGASGASGFHDADVQGNRSAFFVAYLDGQPVGCGALREIDAKTAEIKRVYARKNTCGIGHRLIDSLEERARTLGFDKIILETRAVNRVAVAFYLKNHYEICENYGRYADKTEAICFQKHLD